MSGRSAATKQNANSQNVREHQETHDGHRRRQHSPSRVLPGRLWQLGGTGGFRWRGQIPVPAGPCGQPPSALRAIRVFTDLRHHGIGRLAVLPFSTMTDSTRLSGWIT